MKYRVRVSLEYEDVIEVEGTYAEAEAKGEERRAQLKETMSVLGIIDDENVRTLCLVEEIGENKKAVYELD